MRMFLIFATVMTGLSALPAYTQQTDVGAQQMAADADEPVNITADNLEITEDQDTALFTGNVMIVQGGMELTAPRVEVLYGEGGQSDLVSFTASGGRVKMITEDQEIDADQAVYDFQDRVLTFTGNVVVENASGTVNSARLVIDTRAGTSSFSGAAGGESGGRVTSVFTPGG
jgi:lipopolysaccharide export system protein LptA